MHFRFFPVKLSHSTNYAENADAGEAYAWGWKECVPSSNVASDIAFGGVFQKDVGSRQNISVSDQCELEKL